MGAIYIVGHSMTFTKTGWDVKATHMQLCSDDNVMFMQAKYKVIRVVLARNYIPFQLTFSLLLFMITTLGAYVIPSVLRARRTKGIT